MNFIIIIVSFYFINFSNSERVPIILDRNEQNEFLSNKIFSRENAQQELLGYSQTHVCISKVENRNLFIQLQNVNTFEKSSPLKITYSSTIKKPQLFACFEYMSNSFLIVKDLCTNKTHAFKGQNEKIFSFDYHNIIYDHLLRHLYFTKQNNLYTIKLKSFDRLWKSNENYFLDIEPVMFLRNVNYTDMLIVEKNIFVIKNFSIFTLQKNNSRFITHSNADKFFYLFYPKHEFLIQNGSSKNNYVYIIYLLEMLLIFFLIYCNIDKKLNVYKKFRKNHQPFEQKPIILSQV